MAEGIKRKYNLVALKVTLVTGNSDAILRLEFEVTEAHRPSTLRTWEVPAEDFGLPRRLDPERVLHRGYQFSLPGAIQQDLRSELEYIRHEGPLWLHLVKPYGYLGAVPWEELLHEAVGWPVLRLPDVWAEPPTEFPSSLDVALCASEPAADIPFDLVRSLTRLTEHLLRVPRARVRVDLFTDLRCVGGLRAYFNSAGLLDTSVFVHDPGAASSYAIPRRSLTVKAPREVESPWLLWMREALQGRSVDLVHFLGHGYMDGSKGALGFAESPMLNQDASWCRFVGSEELSLFLGQVGAWSVAIDSPIGNYSEMGLRAIADDLAQQRPGPTLHHESRLDDPDLHELGQAFQFLFTPEPGVPAPLRSVALCCQPFRVKGYQQQMTFTKGIRTRAPLQPPPAPAPHPLSEENVPAWIAAAQRYVEQKQFEVSQVRKTTSVRGSTRSDIQTAGVEKGLDEIKAAIQLMAERRGVKI